jgi:hypothetical protein
MSALRWRLLSTNFSRRTSLFVIVFLYHFEVFGISVSHLLCLFLALLAFSKMTYRVPSRVVVIVMLFCIVSLIQVLLYANQAEYFKQVMLIVIAILGAIGLHGMYSSPVDIFSDYIVLAFYVALFSLIQLLANIFGIRFIYDLSWLFDGYRLTQAFNGWPRIQSIMPEPSHFVQVMSIAIFFSICRIIGVGSRVVTLSRFQAVIILVGALLTLSTLFLVLVFFSGIVLVLVGRSRWLLKSIVTLSLLVMIAGMYIWNEDFSSRIDPIISAVMTGHFVLDADVNFSTLTLINNMHVALENLEYSNYLGSGLGSHGEAFERFNGLRYVQNVPEFNKEDSGSLLIRLPSELGIFGFLLILYTWALLIRSAMNLASLRSEYFPLCGLMAYMAIYFLRMGNYAAYGFWFVLIWYSRLVGWAENRGDSDAEKV